MEPTDSIINTIIAYGICQAFFIGLIMIRSKKTLFKRLFASLLLIEGIILLERLFVETAFINTVPHMLGIAHCISFLKPPIIYLMALSITNRGFMLSKKYWLHSIPFAILVLLNLPFFFLSGVEKIEFVTTFMDEIPSYKNFSFYFTLSFFAHIGIYIFFSLKKLYQFQSLVKNNALVNWYLIILLSYSIFLVLHLLYFLIQPIGQFNFNLINQISMLAMTFIIQGIAFKLIDQSILFKTKIPDLSNLEKRKIDVNLILQKLKVEKIYLNDDLTLESFAKAVSLQKDYVSELINQKFACSFKLIVKQYRLSEAKSILENSMNDDIRLIDVAYQSGFSNKVSFFRAFKEFEGLSPSEYLKSIKSRKKV